MNNAHELDAKARFVKAARSFCDFAEMPYAGDEREMHVVRRHLATLFDLGPKASLHFVRDMGNSLVSHSALQSRCGQG